MNRREFGKSMAAVAVLPAIPASIGTSAHAAAVAKFPYTYAAYMCQAQKQTSVAFLRNVLGYDAKLAQSIHARLLANRVFVPAAVKAAQAGAKPMKVARKASPKSPNVDLIEKAEDYLFEAEDETEA